MNQAEEIVELKKQYVEYYTEAPVQKYAAMYIGRDEDTIIRWRKEDTDFADRVQRAKAEWVRQKLLKVKPEFALERLEKEIFSAKIEVSEVPSAYDEYLANNTTDPNSPDAKALVKDTLDYLMAKTRWVRPTEPRLPPSSTPQQPGNHPS